MQTRQFQCTVEGFTCVGCTKTVTTMVRGSADQYGLVIQEMQADFTTGIVDITLSRCPDEVENALRKAIDETGYDCKSIKEIPHLILSVADTPTELPVLTEAEYAALITPPIVSLEPANKPIHDLPAVPETSTDSTIRNHIIKGVLGAIFGLALMLLSILGVGIPLVAMYVITALSSLFAIYLGAHNIKQAAIKARHGVFDMDALFTASSFTAIAASVGMFFVEWLPMLSEVALLIFAFRHVGTAIEKSLREKVKTKQTYADLIKPTQQVDLINPRKKDNKHPVTIEVLDKFLVSKEVNYADGDIRINTFVSIVIRQGDIIPFDGICLDDEVSVYDTRLSGKTHPITLTKGMPISAGMEVFSGTLTMQVTRSKQSSYLERTDRKIQEAIKESAPLEKTANKILRYFVPIVFLLTALTVAVILTAFPPLLGITLAAAAPMAIKAGIMMLASACPCVFGFITGLVMKTGLTKATDEKINFKSAADLQRASEVKEVYFDLNGTLTQGKPKVVPALSSNMQYKNMAPNKLWHYIRQVENTSRHPVANAICNYIDVNNKSGVVTSSVTVTPEIKKDLSGVRAHVVDKVDDNILFDEHITIGNETMLRKNEFGIQVDAYLHANEAVWNKQTHPQDIIFIAIGANIIGHLVLQDKLRPGAEFTVKELKQRKNRDVFIISGGEEKTVKQYGKILGIPDDHIIAGCHEATNSKAAHFKKGNRAAMVGDAGNDRVAMKTSHLGIAMLSAATDHLTRQEANVEVTNLTSVLKTFDVADQTVSNIKGNFALSLSYNAAAFTGEWVAAGLKVMLSPVIGVLVMIVQSACVLLNILRFKQQKLPDYSQHEKENEIALPPLNTPAFVNQHMPPAHLSLQASNTSTTESTSGLASHPDKTPTLRSSLSIYVDPPTETTRLLLTPS